MVALWPAFACVAGENNSQSILFDIPQQSAESALIEFSEQADLTLVVRLSDVSGKTANALIGNYSLEEGVAALLKGTGLAPSFSQELVLSIDTEASEEAIGGSMNNKTKTGLFASLLAALVGSPGHAQDADANEDLDVVYLDEIVVTGSRIGNSMPTAQVTIIDRADLERRNIQNADEALSLILQNNSGVRSSVAGSNGITGTGFRNLNQSSSPDLRGLGAGSTLTLVNGAPVTASALAQGGANYADIAGIPAVAIERIEVLNDSASAVYGTSAIGGVVNIITRKGYDGVQVSGSYNDNGLGGSDHQVSLFGGTEVGRWNILGGFSYQNSEATTYRDIGVSNQDHTARGGRDYRQILTQPGVFSSFGGPLPGLGGAFEATILPGTRDTLTLADLMPGTVPNSDLDDEYSGESDLYSIFAHADAKLGENINLTLDLIASKRQTNSDRGAPSINTFYFDGSALVSAFPPDPDLFGTFTYSFTNEVAAGLIPRSSAESNTDQITFNAGLTGELAAVPNGKWNLNASYSRDESTLDEFGMGETLFVAVEFDGVIETGDLNVFGDGLNSDPAQLAALGVDEPRVNESATSLLALNGYVQGDLLMLPGGALTGLLGAEFREDSARLFGSSIQGIGQNQDLIGTAGNNIYSLFSEFVVPLVGEDNAVSGIDSLLLTGAVRYADDEDVGTATVYRLGTAWRVSDWVNITASYGTSFRAPSVFQLGEPVSSDFSFTPDFGCPAGFCFGLVQNIAGGNLDLLPEEGDSSSFGMELTPASVPGLLLSVYYQEVNFTDRIVDPLSAFGFAFVTANTELFPTLVIRDDLGNLLQLNATPINLAKSESQSLDVRVGYDLSSPIGDATLTYLGTYQKKISDTVLPGTDPIEMAGTSFRGPKWRHRVSAQLVPKSLPNASISLDISHLPTYTHDVSARGRDTASGSGELQNVDSFTTVDLFASYDFEGFDDAYTKGWGATIAIRNLFDADTPFLDSPIGLDTFNGDPFGRAISVAVTKDF